MRLSRHSAITVSLSPHTRQDFWTLGNGLAWTDTLVRFLRDALYLGRYSIAACLSLDSKRRFSFTMGIADYVIAQ